MGMLLRRHYVEAEPETPVKPVQVPQEELTKDGAVTEKKPGRPKKS